MVTKEISIEIASGLEARPVALLVQEASKFDSKIYISVGDKMVNAKSIMGMMTLGLAKGSLIEISADGTDEDEAIQQITKYLEDK
ncbi:MAG: HPr family phosphocarrier protein [Lachnospiraceae bacterium]|nr:HPr family phosphocarrier protein [Lachnospiraceae bacterium]MDY5741754.1 HPr family phosphocarrier protein [Lachnospiraceae bacterium]